MPEVRRLEDDQLESFDTEPVFTTRWDALRDCIVSDFADQPFHILDLGGGNGVLADRLLDEFPQARVTILDNSELLLEKNRPDDRKQLVLESIENMGSLFQGRTFDVICFNWVLHHLVGDSSSQTDAFVRSALTSSRDLLTDRGRISVFDNMYDGILIDDLPGRLIYQLTKSKRLAQAARRMGANTAGVGVRFRSKQGWQQTFEGASLKTLRYSEHEAMNAKLAWRIFLHMKYERFVGHFWLARK